MLPQQEGELAGEEGGGDGEGEGGGQKSKKKGGCWLSGSPDGSMSLVLRITVLLGRGCLSAGMPRLGWIAHSAFFSSFSSKQSIPPLTYWAMGCHRVVSLSSNSGTSMGSPRRRTSRATSVSSPM